MQKKIRNIGFGIGIFSLISAVVLGIIYFEEVMHYISSIKGRKA